MIWVYTDESTMFLPTGKEHRPPIEHLTHLERESWLMCFMQVSLAPKNINILRATGR